MVINDKYANFRLFDWDFTAKIKAERKIKSTIRGVPISNKNAP